MPLVPRDNVVSNEDNPLDLKMDDSPVALWTKWISVEDESAWELRLDAEVPGRYVIVRKVGRQRLLVQVFVQSDAETERLIRTYGGKREEMVSADWLDPLREGRATQIKVRDRLLITSENDPEALEMLRAEFAGRRVLSVPAELAFGTGEHETTATCLRFLADVAKERGRTQPGVAWSLLDLGTGTGVLAMAARALGAGRVVGWENDPLAVPVAVRNVAGNGFESQEVEIAQRDVFEWDPVTPEWDVITANMFSEILIALFPKMRRALRQDGTLIISGILEEQADETLEAARQAGFQFEQVKTLGKWVTARGGPKPS